MSYKKNISRLKGLVFCTSPKEYTFFDSRSLKPKYFTKDMNNPENAPGLVMQEVDEIKFKGTNQLEYFAPNNVGVLLSITNKSLKSAQTLFDEQVNPNKYNHSLKKADGDRKEFLIKKSKMLYDFVEIIQTCIVFSYTSLEAFTNLSIPDDYEFKQRIDNKGIYETYDKQAIERWIPLKTKVGTILVDIYGTSDLSKKTAWSYFIKLEQYRHDIIHQKSIDITEFYKTYFNQDIFKICSSAQEIIDFFHTHQQEKMNSNALWPWIINKQNHFPMAPYDSGNFEVTGNIYEK